LARKAKSLSPKTILSSWLCRTARYVSADTLKIQRRRQIREQESQMQSTLNQPEPGVWNQIAPLLDEALNCLGESEHDAVVLRFFDGKELKQVAAAMGTTEDAARMRVNRGLEKLRKCFTNKGVTLSTTAMVGALVANSVQAAPVGLAGSIAGTTLASAATAGGTSLRLSKLFMISKAKLVVISAVVAASVAIPLMVAHQSSNKELREKQQAVPEATVSAPVSVPIVQRSVPHQTKPPLVTNAYSRLMKQGLLPELAPEQLSDYLEQNRRSAASLLAAFYATRDKALLREAMDKYPNDPRVCLTALVKGGVAPEQRRQWLELFRQSAPHNSLANYLAAADYLKSGQSSQALQEFAAASKSKLQDYWFDFSQNVEEAYRTAGYSEAEAKMAGISLPVAEFSELRQLAQNTTKLVESYQQAGDEASAQAALQAGLMLGQQLDNPSERCNLAQYGMGLQIENQFLGMLDPNSPYGASGETVKDQLDLINQRLATFKELTQREQSMLQTISDQDLINYADHMKVTGGLQALEWLMEKYGQ
jgi:RNA polymerase sigma factor (sigma-70 family)